MITFVVQMLDYVLDTRTVWPINAQACQLILIEAVPDRPFEQSGPRLDFEDF